MLSEYDLLLPQLGKHVIVLKTTHL